ncbi:hypothetical protein F4859DRAFT_524339 [Xylaria cf. heliscus]|nr:hypothetical protein F4859DRAFT_524339 [Xylaria cf. heliscus]
MSYNASYAKLLVRDQLARELSPPGYRPGGPGGGVGEPGGDPDADRPALPTPSIPIDRHNLPPQHDGWMLPLPGAGRNVQEFKVCIVGAGMAGIYIAYILDKLDIKGISYDILEASDRAGGRVFTHKFSDEKHDYYDIGAMRFPQNNIMKRFFDFLKDTGTSTIPYYYKKDTVKCPVFCNGIQKIDPIEWSDDPFSICQETGIKSADPSEVLTKTMEPYMTKLAKNPEEGFDFLMKVDHYSTREYLRQVENCNRKTVEYIECMCGYTDYFRKAFAESVLQRMDFVTPDWRCIEGGADILTQNALRKLKKQPELKKRVTKIGMRSQFSARSSQAQIETTLQKKGRASSDDVLGEQGRHYLPPLREPKHVMEVQVDGESARQYDMVICTPSLACVQRMNLDEAQLNWGQRTALRALTYTAAVKVAIKFSRPWWITDCGIAKGGLGTTDEPIRVCVYPSYNIDDDQNKPAVLLCSYTWTQDSLRIGSLVHRDSPQGEDVLLEVVLTGVARLHQVDYEKIKKMYITHHSFDWYHDENTAGAVAGFEPGQFSQLYPYLTRPAAGGLLSFAGEAISAHHGWIVGSLESGWRSVYQFLLRYGMFQEIERLQDMFGVPPEVEVGVHGTEHLQVLLGSLEGMNVSK